MSTKPPVKRRRLNANLSNVGTAATVSDVASLAQVSTATVSRALNRPHIVREEVRDRVNAAVKKLGYIGNNSARALRKGTRLIGVVVPTLKYALYATFFESIQAALNAKGFFALLTTSEYDLDTEAEQAMKLVSQGAEGLILVGKTHDRTLVEFLAKTRVPYVNTYVFDPVDNNNVIGFDNMRAIGDAVEYLVSLGHRKLAMLSGLTQNNNDRAKARVKGFINALTVHNLNCDDCVVEAPYSIEGGRSAFREIFNRGILPTAIVCGSDMLALGAIEECRAKGLQIPKDLSIIGFDDLDFAAHIDPPLSTIKVPSVQLGQTAGEYIIALCLGLPRPTVSSFPTELIIRKTTAGPNIRNAASTKDG